jgi:hypothetical protein
MEQSGRRIVFVSYWTSKYEAAAQRLTKSLKTLGLEHDVQRIEDREWKAAVRHKPTFILEMLEKHKDAYAVVWIDADGDVLKAPELLFGLEEDVACYFKYWPSKQREELLSGTFYIKNSDHTRDCVKRWIKTLAAAPQTLMTPEQAVFHKMLPEFGLKVFKLPEAYCHILREPQRRAREPIESDAVIVHYQFSRDTRFDGVPAPILSKKAAITVKEKKISDKVRRREKIAAEDRSAAIAKRRRPHKKGKATPRSLAARRAEAAAKPRVPDSIKLHIRRSKIYAERRRKEEEEKERLRVRELIRRAAHRRVSTKQLEGLISDLDMCCGGVGGHPANPEQILFARQSIAEAKKASDFDKFLPPGKTVILLGNSPTMTLLKKPVLDKYVTIGCNRALRHKDFWPDFLVIGDREPYCQERDSGRLARGAKSGTKILLCESIFNPEEIMRGPYENPYRRAQAMPDFPVYLYTIGPKNKKWNWFDIAAGRHPLPVNTSTFEAPVVSCQNVVGSMLQAAAIMGATRIAVIGIELKWDSEEESHFFGAGKPVGAYPQDSANAVIVPALKVVKSAFKKAGIEVINLSPKKANPFSRVFGNYDLQKFVAESDSLPPLDRERVFSGSETVAPDDGKGGEHEVPEQAGEAAGAQGKPV